jgi:hypothetical protein
MSGTTDRTDWPAGPWDHEPDRILSHHLGFPVLARRGPQGAWCGYVGVPPGHPWHGLDYWSGVDEDRPTLPDIDVHGGITYAKECDDDPVNGICHLSPDGDHVWWIGFDCGHAWDYCPGFEARTRKLLAAIDEKFPGPDYSRTYRDLAYVWNEIIALAEQAEFAA